MSNSFQPCAVLRFTQAIRIPKGPNLFQVDILQACQFIQNAICSCIQGLIFKDQINEVLGIDFLDTEEIITGIYPGGENFQIIVKDESGEVVWESDENFEFEEYEDDYQYNDTNYFSAEDYQKGNFFNYELETEEEFNPEMLVAVLVELLDGRSEIITDIKYKDHEMSKEYGDTTSKGFTYMLN